MQQGAKTVTDLTNQYTLAEIQEMITLGRFYGKTEREVLQQLLATMQREQKLREALEYYALEQTVTGNHISITNYDGGKRARAALADQAECGYITHEPTGKQVTVFYKDLFKDRSEYPETKDK